MVLALALKVFRAGNGDGFKLGVTLTDQTQFLRRILKRNLSFENRARGFNQNDARCITHLYNNTSYNNGNRGTPARSFDFWNGTAATVAINNLDFKHSMSAMFNSQAILSHNTFLIDGNDNTRYEVTKEDFISLDNKGVTSPRQKNGSLPDLNFLKLAKGSDLIDTGTKVDIPYYGISPDIGAFESNYK